MSRKIFLILLTVFTHQAYSYRVKAGEKLYEFPQTRFLPKVTVRVLPDPRISGPHFHLNIERKGETERSVFSCPVDFENRFLESPKDFLVNGFGFMIHFNCIAETGLKENNPRSKQCLEELTELAESGDASAQFNLAVLYSRPDNQIEPDIIPRDFQKALHLAKQAADQNRYPAMNLLFRLYIDSSPETENLEKAIYWAKRGTNQDNEKDPSGRFYHPNKPAEEFLIHLLYLFPICLERMSELEEAQATSLAAQKVKQLFSFRPTLKVSI